MKFNNACSWRPKELHIPSKLRDLQTNGPTEGCLLYPNRRRIPIFVICTESSLNSWLNNLEHRCLPKFPHLILPFSRCEKYSKKMCPHECKRLYNIPRQRESFTKIHREFQVVWECVGNFYVEHTDAVNCIRAAEEGKKINKQR